MGHVETGLRLFGGEVRETCADDPNRLLFLSHFLVGGEDAQVEAADGHHEFPPVKAKGILQLCIRNFRSSDQLTLVFQYFFDM